VRKLLISSDFLFHHNFRVVAILQSEITSCLESIRSNPSYKGAFGRSITRIFYLNQMSPRSDHNTICKEPYLTIPEVIYTKKNFFLLPKLNEKILQVQAAGLTEFWQYQQIHNRKLSEEPKPSLQAISMYDLMGCIQLLLIGFSLSFAAFLFELFRAKCLTFHNVHVEQHVV
jgi:hypothetical protein